jgi:hypothetical protein
LVSSTDHKAPHYVVFSTPCYLHIIIIIIIIIMLHAAQFFLTR